MRCPSCGKENADQAAFCTGCGGRFASGPNPPSRSAARPTPSEPLSESQSGLLNEILAGARRFWPVLGLISLVGMFDYRLNGQLLFPILIGGASAGAVVFSQRLKPYLGELNKYIPQRLIAPLLAGIPAALLYITRWSGTQEGGPALITGILIAGFAIGLAAFRTQINQTLTPLYEARNRFLPKWARMALMFILPLVLTFLVAHQNLGDITALFGGATDQPSTPTESGAGIRIALTTLLSGAVVFLLLNEPQASDERTSA